MSERDALLRELKRQGVAKAVVPALAAPPPRLFRKLWKFDRRSDPLARANRQIASFYGIESVVSQPVSRTRRRTQIRR
jgi:hypothetical protein